MRAILVGLLLCGGVGCGHRRAGTDIESLGPAEAASASELEGVWVVSLTEDELKRLAVRRMALVDALPGEPELRALGLSDADLEQISQLRALPRDAPQLVALAEEVAHFDNSRLVVSRKTMKMQLGAQEKEVLWSVSAREGDLITLRFEALDGSVTTGQIRLGPDETLIFIDSHGSELIFERR